VDVQIKPMESHPENFEKVMGILGDEEKPFNACHTSALLRLASDYEAL